MGLPTQVPQREDLQILRKPDETISAMSVSSGPWESDPVTPSVPDTTNPLHMLAFAAEGSLAGEAREVSGEAVESGDGDLDADAEGETDIEDNHDTMQPLEEQTMNTSQPLLTTPVSVLVERVAAPSSAAPSNSRVSPKLDVIGTDKDKGNENGSAMESQKREQDRAVGVNEVAPVATHPISFNGLVASVESSFTGGFANADSLQSSLENAEAIPATTSSIASPKEILPEPSQPIHPAVGALDLTSYMDTPSQQTTESLRQDQKDLAEDVTMVDPDVDHVSSSKMKMSFVPAGDVAMDTMSFPATFVSADPTSEASNLVRPGGIDTPDKLQFMGAMGDRSLQRHLREMEKAALMQKKPEEEASSSASSIPTAEAKRRKLAPKPSQVASYAKPIKEELEVDGDIWKALALDEAREKQAATSSAAQGKSKTKGKTGKAKKQPLEQAETGQSESLLSNDLMDLDSGSHVVQDEPREKKKATKRGARVCLWIQTNKLLTDQCRLQSSILPPSQSPLPPATKR
jgi:hypothetical protein